MDLGLCLRLPEAVEVAVFVGGEDGFGDGEVGFGFVIGGELFLLEAGLGFQDDPLDVVFGDHRVGYGADFDGDVVAVLLDLGDVFFLGGVGGVGNEGSFVFDLGLGGDDLVIDFVEVHGAASGSVWVE